MKIDCINLIASLGSKKSGGMFLRTLIQGTDPTMGKLALTLLDSGNLFHSCMAFDFFLTLKKSQNLTLQDTRKLA